MYDRIVIPVDGSDEARRAAGRGLDLARAFDAAVDVLHVVERSTLRLARTTGEESRLRERGEAVLAEIAELASELGIPITTEQAEGKPAAEICRYVAERDAALLVVGRQGQTGLGKRLLGSVTEAVLHRSEVPVLAVPDGDQPAGPETGYDRVLLPTDGSENAEAATGNAAAIADRYGATVRVLNVVDLHAAGGVFSAGGLETEFVERLEARGEAAVERAASDVREQAPDVDVETAVERATASRGVAATIDAYVREHDVDLVAVGSHGRSNLARQLLGGVTSTLVRTLDAPVLVVKRTT